MTTYDTKPEADYVLLALVVTGRLRFHCVTSITQSTFLHPLNYSMSSSKISSSSLQVLAVLQPSYKPRSLRVTSRTLVFCFERLHLVSCHTACFGRSNRRLPSMALATPPVHHLPVLYEDLFDCILDQLRDDPSALQQCSLTARCLLRQSRRHLFRKITLKPGDVRVALPQLLISSSISKYIKSCIIDGTHLTDYAKRRITIPTIQHLRHNLPSLTDLTLRGCTIESDLLHDKSEAHSVMSASTSHLRLLDLDHVTFIDIQHLPAMLLCFPSRELHLSRVSVINYSTTYKMPVEMSNKLPLGIRTLKCDVRKSDAVIFDVLACLLKGDSIEDLEVQLQESALDAYSRVVSSVASSVKRLEVTLHLDPRELWCIISQA